MEIRSVCVYCASSTTAPAWLNEEVREFGRGLASRGWRLVYGGASVGVMGALADSVLASSGQVLGVIPRALIGREIAHPGLTELKIVETMHARKAEMFKAADAFVAFPGGFGTMEEFFEMLTWKQMGIHSKPIVFVNSHGFYDPLVAQFERCIAEGIIRKDARILYSLADSGARVFSVLEDSTVLNRQPGKWY
ncbi:MAG: TIGR00730 family Rossman fold protein [Thermoanaerobaculia bacterium]